MKKEIMYYLILMMISNNLFGQITLKFEYELSDFNLPVKSEISIITSKEGIIQLYNDTSKSFEENKKAFFKETGNYKLFCKYFIGDTLIDSIGYNFNVIGYENEISISIHLVQDIKLTYENGKNKEIDRKNRGNISVIKYYKPPDNIYLSKHKKMDVGEHPFFKIYNYSKDTIYGEYLPGYFWGCISYKYDVNKWSRERCGELDMEFVQKEPLYPDSSRIAYVGSFANYRIPEKGLYRFSLLCSRKYIAHGYTKYLFNNTTEWWAKTEEYYRLEKEFEVK